MHTYGFRPSTNSHMYYMCVSCAIHVISCTGGGRWSINGHMYYMCVSCAIHVIWYTGGGWWGPTLCCEKIWKRQICCWLSSSWSLPKSTYNDRGTTHHNLHVAVCVINLFFWSVTENWFTSWRGCHNTTHFRSVLYNVHVVACSLVVCVWGCVYCLYQILLILDQRRSQCML